MVGAIDAVQGQDTVLPWLDLGQTVPEAPAVDLTDLDFADLMAIVVDPAPLPAEHPEIALGDLDFEQLLALQTDSADQTLSGLTSVAMEELMRVEVDADGTEEVPAPFDLTDLGLDTLQELQFGEDTPLPETSHLRFAALDPTSLLGLGSEDAIILFDRVAAPTPIETGDYAARRPARISPMTRTAPAIDPEPAEPPPVAEPRLVAGPPLVAEPVPLPPLPGMPFNRPPNALDDLLETAQGDALTGNVLANDSDPDGDFVSVTSVGVLDTAKLGAVEIAADGQFTYAPPGDFHGTDWFMYSVMDDHGAEASAKVLIEVITANSAPIAADDLFTGATETIISGNVLTNDRDPDGDTLTVSSTGLLTTENGGIVRMQSDGTFEYKPPSAFALTDSVTYWVEDGHGGTANAMLILTIEPLGSSLTGTGADDLLVGTSGRDALVGKDGDDVLIGLDRADILEGGAGIDTASYEDSRTGVEVNLATGEAEGGDAEGDVLSGIENLIGSPDDDLLEGDSGSNGIQGRAGDDVLLGGAGNDLLIGDAGDDILDGGLGIDALLGGAGNDVFVIGPGTGSDLDSIADFKSGEDVIDLDEFGLSGMSELSIDADGSGGSMISLPGGDGLSVLYVDPASLSPDDFIF